MRHLIKLLIYPLNLSPNVVLGERLRWSNLKETSAGLDIWVNKYTGRLFTGKTSGDTRGEVFRIVEISGVRKCLTN